MLDWEDIFDMPLFEGIESGVKTASLFTNPK